MKCTTVEKVSILNSVFLTRDRPLNHWQLCNICNYLSYEASYLFFSFSSLFSPPLTRVSSHSFFLLDFLVPPFYFFHNIVFLPFQIDCLSRRNTTRPLHTIASCFLPLILSPHRLQRSGAIISIRNRKPYNMNGGFKLKSFLASINFAFIEIGLRVLSRERKGKTMVEKPC